MHEILKVLNALLLELFSKVGCDESSSCLLGLSTFFLSQCRLDFCIEICQHFDSGGHTEF